MKSDRERLVEIMAKIAPIDCHRILPDILLAAGFGDVAARDKRIAELEKQMKELHEMYETEEGG